MCETITRLVVCMVWYGPRTFSGFFSSKGFNFNVALVLNYWKLHFQNRHQSNNAANFCSLQNWIKKYGRGGRRIFCLKLSKISKGCLKEILTVYLDPKLQRNLILCNFDIKCYLFSCFLIIYKRIPSLFLNYIEIFK
jgi:hypothetical protein